MGRKRKAWLYGGNGKRTDAGRVLPGYYVIWNEGKRHRSRCFESPKIAREFCRGLNHQFDRARAMGLIAITVEEASREFLAGLNLLGRGTRVDMATVLGRFTEQVEGEFQVVNLTASHVDKYLNDRTDITESTLAKEFRYLRRFLRWCVSHDYAGSDATAKATVRPRTHARNMGPLPSDAQITTLLASIADERMRLGAAISLTTGLDRGVVAAMTSGQVNIGERTIITSRQKTARSRPVTLVIPIHPAICDALADALDRTDPGSPLFEGYYDQEWYEVARSKAGPPWDKLRVGDFRKIASGRLQRVMPATQVQRLLGHSSISTTASHYSPQDPAVQRAFDTLPLSLPPRKRKANRRKRG